MRFTDRNILNLKSRDAEFTEFEDGSHGLGNLGLRVWPSGRKTFVYMYRHRGKARRLTLGTYPQMSLADAHVKAAEFTADKERGLDPAAAVVEDRKAQRQATTVADWATAFLDNHMRAKQRRERTIQEYQRIINAEVLPKIGSVALAAVTKRDILAIEDGIVRRGTRVLANRCHSVLHRMFAWAVERGELEHSPCDGVKKPASESSRDRVLTTAELARFVQRLDSAPISTEVRLAIRLVLLTGVRSAEAAGATWAEFDLERQMWTIPKNWMKNKTAQTVPLSPQAMAVLTQARAANPISSWVFPSPRADSAIAPTALNRAIARNLQYFEIGDLHTHDLRRTLATGVPPLGFSPDLVKRILGHVDGSVTARYDRYEYDKEKRAALEAWAAQVDAAATLGPAISDIGARSRH